MDSYFYLLLKKKWQKLNIVTANKAISFLHVILSFS